MKKKSLVLLTVAVTLVFGACGDDDNKANNTNTTTNESGQVGTSNNNSDDNSDNDSDNSANANNTVKASDEAKELLSNVECNIKLEAADSDREGQGRVSTERMYIVTNGAEIKKIYGLSGGAFSQAGSIHNNMYVSYIDGDYGLMHVDGTTLIEYGKFDYLEWYSDEYLYFKDDDNGNDETGLIDINGNVMIEPIYNMIEDDYGSMEGVLHGMKTTDDIKYLMAENGRMLLEIDANDPEQRENSISDRFYTGAMALNDVEPIGKLGAWTVNDEPIIRSVETGEVIFDISDVEGELCVSWEAGAAFDYRVTENGDRVVKYAIFNEDFTKVHTIDELDGVSMDSMFCTDKHRIFITDNENMLVYNTNGERVELVEDVYQAWIYDNELYYIKIEQAMDVIHNDTQKETYMGMFTVYSLSGGKLVSSVVNGDTKGIYQLTGTFNESENKFENYKLVNALNGEVVYDTDEIKFASLSYNYLELNNGNAVTYTATEIYEHSMDEALYKDFGEWAIFRKVTDEYKESKVLDNLSTEEDIIRVPGNKVIHTFDNSKYTWEEGPIYCDVETESKIYNIFGELIYVLGTYEK